MAVHSHVRGVEGGTAVEADRRELGIVPHQDQGIALPLPDVVQQVLEEIAAAEERACRIYGNQRCLVHDVAGPAVLVQVQDKFSSAGVHRFLPVDLLVNRSGLLAGVARQHLCRTASRSHQSEPQVQSLHRPHGRAHRLRLTRTGIAVDYHDVALPGQKGRQPREKLVLAGRRLIREGLPYLLLQKFPDSHRLDFLEDEEQHQQGVDLQTAEKHLYGHHHFGEWSKMREIAHRAAGSQAGADVAHRCQGSSEGLLEIRAGQGYKQHSYDEYQGKCHDIQYSRSG